MRFKEFIQNENMWGNIPALNPPSQPYWLKNGTISMSSNQPQSGSATGGMPGMPQQAGKKMMKKKMKKN